LLTYYFPLFFHGIAVATGQRGNVDGEIDEILQKVRLSLDIKDSYLHELSGGRFSLSALPGQFLQTLRS